METLAPRRPGHQPVPRPRPCAPPRQASNPRMGTGRRTLGGLCLGSTITAPGGVRASVPPPGQCPGTPTGAHQAASSSRHSPAQGPTCRRSRLCQHRRWGPSREPASHCEQAAAATPSVTGQGRLSPAVALCPSPGPPWRNVSLRQGDRQKQPPPARDRGPRKSRHRAVRAAPWACGQLHGAAGPAPWDAGLTSCPPRRRHPCVHSGAPALLPLCLGPGVRHARSPRSHSACSQGVRSARCWRRAARPAEQDL